MATVGVGSLVSGAGVGVSAGAGVVVTTAAAAGVGEAGASVARRTSVGMAVASMTRAGVAVAFSMTAESQPDRAATRRTSEPANKINRRLEAVMAISISQEWINIKLLS
jgi:hypothetical protein